MSRVKRVYIHCIDRATRATNTIPLLAARIAVEPVGVVEPLGAIGGGVKVHESLSCERYWFISIPLQGTRACCAASSTEPHARSLPNRVRCADGTFAHAASATKSQRAPSTAAAATCQGRGAMVACVVDARSWLGRTHAHTRRETRGGGARARAGKRTTTSTTTRAASTLRLSQV